MIGTTDTSASGNAPPTFADRLNDAVGKGVTNAAQLLSIINQQKLFNENLKRARSGQSMIDIAQVPGSAPTVRGEVDVGANTAGLGRIALFGALGLGALYLFTRNRRRR